MIVERCPFCLGTEQDLIGRSGPFMREGWRVECDCGGSGPRKPDKWEAIAAWNYASEQQQIVRRIAE
jgi:hypothetical protein